MRRFFVILLAVTWLVPPGVVLAAGDAVEGELLFNTMCSYCHSLSGRHDGEIRLGKDDEEALRRGLSRRPQIPAEPEKPEVEVRGIYRRGPHLANLLDRPPGGAEGYHYRLVMKVAGSAWTVAELDHWIDFHALVDEATDRADLIAYLKVATRR